MLGSYAVAVLLSIVLVFPVFEAMLGSLEGQSHQVTWTVVVTPLEEDLDVTPGSFTVLSGLDDGVVDAADETETGQATIDSPNPTTTQTSAACRVIETHHDVSSRLSGCRDQF
jgi:hypothetical protein